MRVLVDISHPAHVHFFRHPLRLLREGGAEVRVTSRVKDVARTLLDELGIAHEILSIEPSNLVGRARELIVRDFRLWCVVRRFRPDVMAAIGGTFVAHVGALTGVPALVFYDTENARLQNAITYPLAHHVFVPRCYQGWVPAARSTRYAGYHELAYLRPEYFHADREVALAHGLAPEAPTFLVRLVAWKASHDIGKRGWSPDLARRVVARLAAAGTVLMSSEAPLPEDLRPYTYAGQPGLLHHVMAFCRGFVGESATMASECAVLGVPAVYAAHTGRGYTDEQERRYGLVRNTSTLTVEALDAAIDWLLSRDPTDTVHARAQLLAETIDVSRYVVDSIESAAVRSCAVARGA
jgi:predicted glycosyltransferase